MLKPRHIIYLIITFISLGIIYAQEAKPGATSDSTQAKSRKNKALQVGIGLTATNYVGDLTQDFWALTRFYPGVNLSLQTDGRSNLKGQVNFGMGTFAEQRSSEYITSDNPKVRPNNFVYTPFFYGDLRFRYRFLRTLPIQPHISLGAGIMTFAPTDQLDNALFEAPKTRPPGEEYETFTFYIPATAGVNLRVSPMLALGMDYTFRRIFTDYTDNVGQLGTRKGNDYLQNLQLTMLVTPNPQRKEKSLVPIVPSDEIKIYKPKQNKDSVKQVRDSILAEAREKRRWEKRKASLRPVDSLIVEETVFLDVLGGNIELMKVPYQKEDDGLSNLDRLFAEDSLINNPTEVKEGYETLVYDPYATKEDSAAAITYITKNGIKIPSNLPMPPAPRNDGCPDLWVCLEEKEWRALNFFYYECKPGDAYTRLYNRFRIRKSTILLLNENAEEKAPPAKGLLLLPDVRQWIEMLPDEKRIRKESGIGFVEVDPDVQIVEPEKAALSPEEEKVEMAILEKRFIYYLVNPSDSLDSIAERFKVKKEILQQLNSLIGTKVIPNTYLRIPDVK
ncbi:MAG: LysM peptidoglycan-binding domain-containing protein [Bacteroidia bacterium]